MTAPLGSIRTLRSALANSVTTPTRLAEAALANANRNASGNTYLWHDPAWTLREAERAEQMPRGEGGPFGDGRDTLWGLPISVKDCFDLAGAPTTCGTTFYRDKNGVAQQDSWMVERLRARGAVITGKTHLHPLAYGITGENPEFGDCLQPGKDDALTGGSSSGACASVMEGSAVAAIGTDTGGSVRVPAALCGLAGYRASLGRGDWRGGAHLSQSFDTLGWLFADVEEAPLLGAFYADHEPAHDLPHIRAYGRFAIVGEDFLHDCEPEIVESYRDTIRDLEDLGLSSTEISVDWWGDAQDIFAPIQAWEAAGLHRGNFEHFETAIRERLEWGARITPDEIADLRQRHEEFKSRMDDLFDQHQLVILPAAPVATLAAGADHSNTRKRLLRYTVAISMAGAPAVTIPCTAGGMQIAAARNQDESLLQLVALLGARRKASAPVLNA
ncbi:amidase [Occallatibacter riparius]|uniref:Amidase n=1 Tax=Occallatibacter riparius TaxID=1002689 RepID=A0A9J7BLY6_9BACT|nr:amidase [Occallatibacter riparius]UWZ83675.1 amidase [Occallatibacter riparius]